MDDTLASAHVNAHTSSRARAHASARLVALHLMRADFGVRIPGARVRQKQGELG
jgi:hypothetical protein